MCITLVYILIMLRSTSKIFSNTFFCNECYWLLFIKNIGLCKVVISCIGVNACPMLEGQGS